jgi:hypothetical protein
VACCCGSPPGAGPRTSAENCCAEWEAELATLTHGSQRWGFAASLAVSGPDTELTPAYSNSRRVWPVPVLLLAGFVLHLAATSRSGPLTGVTAAGVGTALLAFAAAAGLGWAAGWFAPFQPTGRLGRVRSAVWAPVVLAVFWVPSLWALGWAVPLLVAVRVGGGAALGVATARRAADARLGRGLLMATGGVIGLTAAGALVAVLYFVAMEPAGAAAAWRAVGATVSGGIRSDAGDTFVAILGLALPAVPYLVMATLFGIAAGYRRTVAPAAQLAPQPATGPTRLPLAATVAGAVAAAVLTWAYAFAHIRLAVFAPHLQDFVWDNDGTPYTWSGELRSAAILMGALGIAVLTADRRSALRAALAFGLTLYIGDWSFTAAELSGGRSLTACLAVGGVAVALAWWAAGARITDASAAIGRRLRIVAIVTVGCAPLLLTSGRDVDERAVLPLGMYLAADVLAAVLMGLGITAALVSRRRPIPVPVAVALVVLPFGVLASLASTIDLGRWAETIAAAALLGLVPLVALLGFPRGGNRTRTVGAVVAAIVAAPFVLYGSLIASMFLPSALTLAPGAGEEGLSFAVPAAYLLLIITAGVVRVPAPERKVTTAPAVGTPGVTSA